METETSILFEDLLRCRANLNGFLFERIEKLYPKKFFAREIKRRIEKGRKVRSLLFLAVAEALNSKVNREMCIDICLSIEMLHAASCLVDDVLDGDDIRHGHKSSQAVLGTPVSLRQAHFLCAEALTVINRQGEIFELLVTTYQRTVLGEMYDVFIPEPVGKWICGGYAEEVYQKTSAMFEFVFETAALVTGHGDLRKQLKLLGRSLGRLYQISNDYYDMQPQNIRKRHSANDSWRITFSLPIACYLKLYGAKAIRAELDNGMLTYDEWMDFLKKIWMGDVRKLSHKMLTDACGEAKIMIRRSGLPVIIKRQLSGLVGLVAQEGFWYHPC